MSDDITEMYVTEFYHRQDGAYERVRMFAVDYKEAHAGVERTRWSRSEPPPGSEVIDKVPPPIVIERQEASPPPMVPRNMASGRLPR